MNNSTSVLHEVLVAFGDCKAHGFVVSPTMIALMGGDVSATLILAKLIYWHETGKDNKQRARYKDTDGVWVVKTIQEWSEETGLSLDTCRRSIERLRGSDFILSKKSSCPKLGYMQGVVHLAIEPMKFVEAMKSLYPSGSSHDGINATMSDENDNHQGINATMNDHQGINAEINNNILRSQYTTSRRLQPVGVIVGGSLDTEKEGKPERTIGKLEAYIASLGGKDKLPMQLVDKLTDKKPSLSDMYDTDPKFKAWVETEVTDWWKRSGKGKAIIFVGALQKGIEKKENGDPSWFEDFCVGFEFKQPAKEDRPEDYLDIEAAIRGD